jgi:hypothetical protein
MRLGTTEMSLFDSARLSPKQFERRKKIWAKGRKRFILCRGILGWGMLTFALTTLSNWYSGFGWHLPPAPKVYFDIAIGLAIWPVGGYFWAAAIWKKLIETPVLEYQLSSNKTEGT